MYYTGIDTHSKYSQFEHMDEDGALGLSQSVPTDKESIERFLAQLDDPTVITFEAGRNYWWLHEYFQGHPMVSDVVVVDPRRSRRLAEELSVQSGYGRAKNDHIDGEMLAEQTRLGLAPRIYVPTAEQLELRTINRFRHVTVKYRTQTKNYFHSILAMHGKAISIKKFMEDSDAKKQLYESLPSYIQIILNQLQSRINSWNKQIISLDSELSRLLPECDPRMKIILTAPGIGPILGRTINSEILDIDYFGEPKYLVSYSGLAPIIHDSAGHKGPEKLNRYSNRYLKYAFVEAAHNASDHPRYRKKYEYDVKKHGKIRAKLNLARCIAKTVYWMLTRQQPYKI
ncbi:IS110 family transposase [Patescibacteria group bacterium]|nr:IS110 family transposase [Patescibacteria group bacterium]